MNKSAVEVNWSADFTEVGKEFSGKALHGWNAAESQLVYGGMNAIGYIWHGTVKPDETAKCLTLSDEGINGDGGKTSSTTVVRKTGRDTLTWQVLASEGGLVEGVRHVVRQLVHVLQDQRATGGGGVPGEGCLVEREPEGRRREMRKGVVL